MFDLIAAARWLPVAEAARLMPAVPIAGFSTELAWGARRRGT